MNDAAIPARDRAVRRPAAASPRSWRSSFARCGCRTRSPSSSPGCSSGSAAERRRVPADRRLARPRPARPAAGPRLRGRLPAADRASSGAGSAASRCWRSRASSISAAVVAVVLTSRPGCRLDLAFIVGAMVSATDPAAVVATFKRLRVPPALSTMVDGESLLNDGTGLVLFAHRRRRPSTRRSGPVEAVVSVRRPRSCISVAIGLGTGFSPPGSIGLVDDHLIELTISVVLAYGSYIARRPVPPVRASSPPSPPRSCSATSGPGRTMSATGEDAIDTVWEFLAYLLTAVVFLLVGSRDPAGAPARLASARSPGRSSAILVGRALVVYVLLGGVSRLAPVPGARRARARRLAPRPVLGRSPRGGRGRDGAVAAGRHPAARRCSRRSPSGSSCSRCWSRARPSAALTSIGRSAPTRGRVPRRRPRRARRA